jgi:hypothetical protein
MEKIFSILCNGKPDNEHQDSATFCSLFNGTVSRLDYNMVE